MTFFDCTADLVVQLNENGQKGMLQIDAPPVKNFWLRHWYNVKLRDEDECLLQWYYSNKHYSEFYPKDGGENQLRWIWNEITSRPPYV